MSKLKLSTLLVGLLLLSLTFPHLSNSQSTGGFNVNMDIDIDQGDNLVNTLSVYKFSVFTSR